MEKTHYLIYFFDYVDSAELRKCTKAYSKLIKQQYQVEADRKPLFTEHKGRKERIK